jgi:hypothetical protein
MGLEHLTGLFTNDHLGSQVAKHGSVSGKTSCRDANHIGREK